MKLRNLIVFAVLVHALFLPKIIFALAEEDMIGVGYFGLSLGQENVWSTLGQVDANPSVGADLVILTSRPGKLAFGFNLSGFHYSGEITTPFTDLRYNQTFLGGGILTGTVFERKNRIVALYVGPEIYRHSRPFEDSPNENEVALGVMVGAFLQMSGESSASLRDSGTGFAIGVGARHLFKYDESYQLFLTGGFCW